VSPFRGKKSQILPFFKFVILPWLCPALQRQSFMRMHIYNNPLSKDTKVVSVFQRTDGEVAFTNFVVQKHDGQIKNKQTKKHKTFLPPGGARYLSHTKLATVMEEVRTFLYLQNMFASALTYSFATRGRSKFGVISIPRNINPHNSEVH